MSVSISPTYKCVIFPRDKGSLKSIDGIPSKWIFYDPSIDKLMSFYPEINANDHTRYEEFQTMVKYNKDPDKSWPIHEVEIRGVADTYDELEEKLKVLSKQSFAFSSDTDISPKRRGVLEKQKYRCRIVKTSSDEVSQLFEDGQQNLPKRRRSVNARTQDAVHERLSKQSNDDISFEKCNLEKSISSADGSTTRFSVSPTSFVTGNASKRGLAKLNSSSDSSSPPESLPKKKKRGDENLKRSRSKTSSNLPDTSNHMTVNAVIHRSQTKTADQLKNMTLAKTSKERRDEERLTATPRRTKVYQLSQTPPLSPSSIHSSVLISSKPKNIPSPRSPLDDISNLCTSHNSRKSPQSRLQNSDINTRKPGEITASFSGSVDDLEEDALGDEKRTLKEMMIICCRQVHKIGNKIDLLKGQVVELKNQVSQMKSAAHRGQLVEGFYIESDEDEAPHGFKLPCKTLDELKAFDKQLQEDKAYRKKICMNVHKCINKERSLSRNLGEILRKFITQQVANQITPLKKVEGKELFKKLKFYSCLVAVFCLKFGSNKEPLEYKAFNSALSGALNSSGDWDGGRARRAKRAKATKSIHQDLANVVMAEMLADK